MRTLRRLREDGLEDLGTIELSTTVVIGDPSALVTTPGSGQWFGAGVRPGTWRLLGRPWWKDEDLLEELVLVHESALDGFYALYDEAVPLATVPLPRHRLVVLDGPLRTDTDALRAMVEPEELPWVADRGCVVAGIEEFPGQIIGPRAPETLLISIGLSRPPAQQVPAEPFGRDREREEDLE